MIAGVYVIFGPDKRVYVGESASVLTRKTLTVSRSLGLDWSIVKYMPGSTGTERSRTEKKIMKAYRAAGYVVVSKSKGGVGHRRPWSQERRVTFSATMTRIMSDPARKQAARERMSHFNASLTHEQRSELMRRGWETRRNRKDG